MLAILGGQPEVTFPQPHGRWPIYPLKVKESIKEYLSQEGELSISDRTGIVEELEERFIDYYGLPYALLTNSGSNALHAAFVSIGLDPGDEVIAPSYAFHACITSVIHRQAVPVLCDSEYDSVNIDPDAIEDQITSRTRAIVVVHNWGHPVNLERIRSIANKHGLYLIEDCSHAHGSEYNGQKVGTFGDISCFSLQANKLICAGEGGLLLTRNRELYERSCLVGHYRGRSYTTIETEFYKQFAETGYGLKYRIHPLAAVIAKEFLSGLDEEVERRNNLVKMLNRALEEFPGFSPPKVKDYATKHSYYGYKPTIDSTQLDGIRAESIIQALRAEGVEIHKPTFKAIHQLELYQRKHIRLYSSMPNNWRVYKAGDFPNVERLGNELLSLTLPTGPAAESVTTQYMNAFHKVFDSLPLIYKLEKKQLDSSLIS
ncbi:DegT/DnrJ/EryC1/StrS family aminotransferase [Candidatus Pristimantibacillus sp. PTI5]|uniref:DegT/DnrJ/EryC1/StrS family aminotransferase n=1 Tax=Candidatus Pristimantibacillus sp. PTI5 TaxID=3400422 RepID=UPI003B01D942